MTPTNHPGQLDLFGDPTDTPTRSGQRTQTRAAETNDIDLIHHIAGNATRGVYVLVGNSERVYARADGPDSHDVVRVPRYEEDAVHQLLRRRLLTLGGTHRVTCGAASLTATAVLTPKSTRSLVTRWEHLQRPTSWTAHNHGRR